ncbi:MAG: OadG family protein [Proteobacteria bacterium]|jgi:Na+-transporting methylmalonyl-CoA/oxaloacetate decarboxylase gamma subunit|nr:OadG family protein [Pseudomonadota bacterium]MBT5794205.1 OadG family protein [Deltaproteobacteria bacterium]
MLWEGLKLMGVGMATVMLFLMLMIACIEWVKYLNRNFTALEQQAQKARRKSGNSPAKQQVISAVPVEVFAAAITAFEADSKTS